MPPYTDLKMQDYLSLNKFSTSEVKAVFSWRTRMAYFNENFKSSYGHIPCPLCHLHLDSQVMAFKWPELKAYNIKIIEKYEDIPQMLVKSVMKIIKYRETKKQERN